MEIVASLLLHRFCGTNCLMRIRFESELSTFKSKLTTYLFKKF